MQWMIGKGGFMGSGGLGKGRFRGSGDWGRVI